MARPKGIPMSEDAKHRISESKKGQLKSEETRRRMSEAAKRRSSDYYVRTFHSPEARQKAAAANKGKVPWHAGRPMPENLRRAISAAKKGRPKSTEHRRKMAESRRGEKSHLWRGGVHAAHTRERQRAMQTIEYRLWRDTVFTRDSATCQMRDGTCAGPLQADHVQSWRDYPELRYVVSNGRTLCRHHHQQTPNFAGRAFRNTRKAA